MLNFLYRDCLFFFDSPRICLARSATRRRTAGDMQDNSVVSLAGKNWNIVFFFQNSGETQCMDTVAGEDDRINSTMATLG